MLSPQNYTRCKQLIADHGLDAVRDSITDFAVDSVSLFRNESRDPNIVGASRYGGRPDLPVNNEWPRTLKGELLGFFMQLNLEDVPRFPDNTLPESGVLYFFLEEDDCGPVKHRIVYAAPGAMLQKTIPPEGKFTIDFAENYSALKPHAIDCRLAFDVPGYGSPLFDAIDRVSDSAARNYFAFMESANLGSCEQSLNGQLFGYSSFDGGSQFQLVEDLTHVSALEWTAFWRIDSDMVVGACIMDAGAYQAYIPTSDLQSLDFSSTFAVVVDAG